jgi:hypothetical protein
MISRQACPLLPVSALGDVVLAPLSSSQLVPWEEPPVPLTAGVLVPPTWKEPPAPLAAVVLTPPTWENPPVPLAAVALAPPASPQLGDWDEPTPFVGILVTRLLAVLAGCHRIRGVVYTAAVAVACELPPNRTDLAPSNGTALADSASAPAPFHDHPLSFSFLSCHG